MAGKIFSEVQQSYIEKDILKYYTYYKQNKERCNIYMSKENYK